MQLIDTRCPMCMGNVVRIPGTNTGECETSSDEADILFDMLNDLQGYYE